MLKLILFILFSSLLFIQSASASELISIDLSQHQDGQTTGNNYVYMRDSSQKLTIEDVSQSAHWFTPEAGVHNRGLSPTLSWMKFNLSNANELPWSVILEYVDASVERIDLYYRRLNSNEAFQHKKFIFKLPSSNREVSFYRPAFHIDVPALETIEIYVRIFQGNDFPMHSFTSMRIWQENKFYRSIQIELSFLVLLICTEILMGIVTLIVFLILRDKLFLYYSLFTFSSASLFASLSGLWSYFIATGGYQLWMVVFQISIGHICAILFVRCFFNIKRYSLVLNKLLLVALSIATLGAVLNLFGLPYYSRTIIDYTAWGYILLLPLGIYAWKKQIPHALLFTFSWMIFIVGMLFGSLRLRGYISDTFITQWIIYVGGFFEVFLLSTIMALRLIKMRKEKDAFIIQNQQDKLIYQKQLMVNERKTTNELRELNALKDQFLSNTSHELRTPLNGIIGLSEILQQEQQPTDWLEMKKSIQAINQCGNQLKYIVDELLDFSQLNDKKLVLNRQKFELISLVEQIAWLLQPQAKLRLVTIVIDVEGQSCHVFADQKWIKKVLYNLVNNAIKFSERSTVTIKLRNQADKMNISIADQGLGIASDQLQKVFAAFTQSDGSGTRKQGGIGLGLAICKNVIEMHGDQLSLKSQFGKGSEFSFNLQYLV